MEHLSVARLRTKYQDIYDYFWLGHIANIFSESRLAVSWICLAPYPPFGLSTITILKNSWRISNVVGNIYNSATLVSMNNSLRNNIHKRALKSNLIDLIGHAEMENEIQKTVTEIIQSQHRIKIGNPKCSRTG